MFKKKRIIFTQVLGLLAFCFMAASSSSQGSSSSGSGFDYRGAAVGAAAGYNGYTLIGSAESESEARRLAVRKGYDSYIWDSVNNNVYAK